MSTVDKLLEVGLVARAVSQNFLYRRTVSKLIVVVISAVITGMLTGALLIAGLYVSHYSSRLFISHFVYFVGKLREALFPQLELMKHSLQHFTLF